MKIEERIGKMIDKESLSKIISLEKEIDGTILNGIVKYMNEKYYGANDKLNGLYEIRLLITNKDVPREKGDSSWVFK